MKTTDKLNIIYNLTDKKKLCLMRKDKEKTIKYIPTFRQYCLDRRVSLRTPLGWAGGGNDPPHIGRTFTDFLQTKISLIGIISVPAYTVLCEYYFYSLFRSRFFIYVFKVIRYFVYISFVM